MSQIDIYRSFLPLNSCHLPVCNEICEIGELHKLECAVFSAVVNYNRNDDTKDTDIEGLSIVDDSSQNKEAEELRKSLQITKYDSPSPIYSCITPLRMLLKCQEDMTRETMELQNGGNRKDETDVSKATSVITEIKPDIKHKNNIKKYIY